MMVAPFAGAWIEIIQFSSFLTARSVAPFAGAWIEIEAGGYHRREKAVAPFAGAWIEIFNVFGNVHVLMSLPSRERGLKSGNVRNAIGKMRRSLRGSVD